MKSFLSRVYLAAVLIFIFSPSATKAQNLKKCWNDSARYIIYIPETWAFDYIENHCDARRKPVNDLDTMSPLLKIYTEGGEYPDEKAFQKVYKSTLDTVKGFELKRHEYMKIRDMYVLNLEYKVTMDDFVIVESIYVYYHNKIGYALIFASEPGKVKEYKPEFDLIAKNFNFK